MPFIQLEVIARYKRKKGNEQPITIKTADDAAKAIRCICNKGHILWIEEMFMLCLNANKQLLCWTQIASGGTNYLLPDLRVVATKAALSTASFFIIAHNHPSGILKPSAFDIETTYKIISCLKTQGSDLLDHIIFTDTDYLSMKDNGYL